MRSSTLPETGVEWTRSVEIETVDHWSLAEVNDLMEAELSTID